MKKNWKCWQEPETCVLGCVVRPACVCIRVTHVKVLLPVLNRFLSRWPFSPSACMKGGTGSGYLRRFFMAVTSNKAKKTLFLWIGNQVNPLKSLINSRSATRPSETRGIGCLSLARSNRSFEHFTNLLIFWINASKKWRAQTERKKKKKKKKSSLFIFNPFFPWHSMKTCWYN